MRRKMCLIMSLMVALCLSACGSLGSTAKYSAEAPSEDAYYDGYEEYEEFESNDIYSSSEAYAAKETSDEADNSLSDEQLEGQTSSRKLIKTVNMSAQTKEFDELISTVTKRIDSLGGYAETMDVSGYEYNASQTSVRNAYIVARIPSSKLDLFINTVSENSNITSKNESTQDVTLEYSDVEAHRNSLRVEQQRLNELLKDADSIETIVALEQRLSEVRYELESYESRLRNIDNRVDYSTVYLDVQEVKDYTPVVTKELSFGERIASGFVEGCVDAVDALGDFVVGFVSILPGLIVFLLILGIIVLVIFVIVKIIIKAVNKSAGKKKSKNKAGTENVAVILDKKPEIKNNGNQEKKTDAAE